MRFIDDQQPIGRQVIKQRRRWLTRSTTGEEARVVLNPGTVAQLVHHLQIKLGTLGQPLLFQQFVVFQQHFASGGQLFFDLLHRLYDALARCDVVRFRVDGKTWNSGNNLPGERVK